MLGTLTCLPTTFTEGLCSHCSSYFPFALCIYRGEESKTGGRTKKNTQKRKTFSKSSDNDVPEGVLRCWSTSVKHEEQCTIAKRFDSEKQKKTVVKPKGKKKSKQRKTLRVWMREAWRTLLNTNVTKLLVWNKPLAPRVHFVKNAWVHSQHQKPEIFARRQREAMTKVL